MLKDKRKYQSGDAIKTQMLKEAGFTLEQYEKACISVEEFINLVGIKKPTHPQLKDKRKVCEHNWFDNSLDNSCVCEKCGINYKEFITNANLRSLKQTDTSSLQVLLKEFRLKCVIKTGTKRVPRVGYFTTPHSTIAVGHDPEIVEDFIKRAYHQGWSDKQKEHEKEVEAAYHVKVQNL